MIGAYRPAKAGPQFTIQSPHSRLTWHETRHAFSTKKTYSPLLTLLVKYPMLGAKPKRFCPKYKVMA